MVGPEELDRLRLAADGRVESVGLRFAERLGYSPGELAGQPLKLILGRWCPDEPTAEALRALFEGPSPKPFLNLTGAEVPLRVHVESVAGGAVALRAEPPPPPPPKPPVPKPSPAPDAAPAAPSVPPPTP
ncbi:MAG TPA: hypothetical protein PKZ00_07325, partial [Elusimicrobiota bacterium]|nr:hypothetical protein [Elusimicrobiota bacterium]